MIIKFDQVILPRSRLVYYPKIKYFNYIDIIIFQRKITLMDTKIAFDNTPNSFMIFKKKKLSNRNKKPDVAMKICNSSTWKAEVERSVQI